ncbi:CopG family transcriptional regulator [Halostagnicola bangensis]
MTRRMTVSLDDDAETALETLMSQTDNGQSEVVRRALAFYAANFEAASGRPSDNLEQYYQMLSSGEHVLLDVDFLHCFLEHLYEDGDPDPAFVEAADRVSDYHAREYAERFDGVEELLEWLSFCGFLGVRTQEDGVYQIVFASEPIRWFMTRFIERSTVDLPVDIEIDQGLSKVFITERPAGEQNEGE